MPDIISFIYRDEYYNPDSPEKGVAEVIIAKQRKWFDRNRKVVFEGNTLDLTIILSVPQTIICKSKTDNATFHTTVLIEQCCYKSVNSEKNHTTDTPKMVRLDQICFLQEYT